MSDFILPGAHGVGSYGYNATDGDYKKAANHLVDLYNEGRHVDTSDKYVQDVLYVHGARNLDELKTKLRGW